MSNSLIQELSGTGRSRSLSDADGQIAGGKSLGLRTVHQYLFVTRGYNGTTTAKIGKLAGRTKGAVHFYFQDKGILMGVREFVADLTAEAMA